MASPDHIFPSPVTFQKTGSRILEVDFETAQKILEFEKEFPETKMMDRVGRYEFLNKKIAELRSDWEMKRGDRQKQEKKLAYLKNKKTIFDAISDWGCTSLRLEKPDGVSFRAMRRAVSEGKTVYFAQDFYADVPKIDFEKEVFRFAEIMLVEHDWAGALKNADTSHASVRLPYDVCAFEFRFSGRPVIALTTQIETSIVITPVVFWDGTWLLCDSVWELEWETDPEGEGIIGITMLMAKQIKAICIALDANVATSEVVREPHLANHGKNHHQTVKPYHVVSLVHRGSRPLPLAGQPTGRHVRLHFRRGHWRHFESHKTWIKWMLVGDPDLGFVDKHYKL